MVRVFDNLPFGASSVYEVGTALGVFVWDRASRAWSRTDVGEAAERRGHCHICLQQPPLLASFGAAREELQAASAAVPPGLGMVVSWSDHGPDGVFLAMAACELADLEYGAPAWAT